MIASKRRPGLRLAWGLVCLITGTTGCLVNESRCDANQVRDPDNAGLCKCIANAVLSPNGYGCDKCSETEEIRGGKCECVPGYVRGAAGGCEKSTTSTLWEPCSEAEPCTEPYPLCATVGGSQYCTNTGCKKNEDCPEDFVCRSEGAVSFCSKVVGMIKTCATAADCAGTEALYCETLQAKVCLVQDCVSSAACPSGWSCCDLKRFIQTSLCIRTSLLDSGKCIDGSDPVKP